MLDGGRQFTSILVDGPIGGHRRGTRLLPFAGGCSGGVPIVFACPVRSVRLGIAGAACGRDSPRIWTAQGFRSRVMRRSRCAGLAGYVRCYTASLGGLLIGRPRGRWVVLACPVVDGIMSLVGWIVRLDRRVVAVGAEDWATRLRELDQKVTPARRAVLEVVASTDAHLSADEIVSRVADLAPEVHRATVFRTLERLVELGLVAHVHLPHGATTFHLREPGERMHLHVLCRACGEVFDTDPTLLDGVAASLSESLGFELAADHAALSGVCATCAAESADRVDVERQL